MWRLKTSRCISLFVCLFIYVVFRQEFYNHLKTSLLPFKSCKCWPMFGTYRNISKCRPNSKVKVTRSTILVRKGLVTMITRVKLIMEEDVFYLVLKILIINSLIGSLSSSGSFDSIYMLTHNIVRFKQLSIKVWWRVMHSTSGESLIMLTAEISVQHTFTCSSYHLALSTLAPVWKKYIISEHIFN